MTTTAYISEMNITITDEERQNEIFESWTRHEDVTFTFDEDGRMDFDTQDFNVGSSFWDDAEFFFREEVLPFAEIDDYVELISEEECESAVIYSLEEDGTVKTHERINVYPTMNPNHLISRLICYGADPQELMDVLQQQVSK